MLIQDHGEHDGRSPDRAVHDRRTKTKAGVVGRLRRCLGMNDDRKDALRAFLDQPFIGFAPWILLSVVEGPDRVALASALALALALAITVAGAIVDMSPKLLELTAIVFFGALCVIAIVSGADTSRWLGVWSAEICNVAIAAITLGSIAARRDRKSVV